MKPDIKIIQAPRPTTIDEEDRVLLEAFRKALTDCADILQMPGSPNLTDVSTALKVRLLRDSKE